MRARFLKCLYLCAALAWGALAWATYHRPAPATGSRPAAPATAAEKHYVTPKQLADSAKMQDQPLGPLAALGHDGRRYTWDEIAVGKPVVLVFIKKGCACSAEFEPFFHRLEAAYRDRVRFAGVIDGSADEARRYAADNKVPYPVLADAGQAIIARLKAENGGYVVLLRPDGVVETLWPGCSATMMRELGRRIADLAEVDERPLDTTGMPAVLTTGCPYGT